MKTNTLDKAFAALAYRINIYLQRDPRQLEKFFERQKELFNERPLLKKLHKMMVLQYKLLLETASLLTSLFQTAKADLPDELMPIFTSALKIEKLKANAISVIKRYKAFGISTKVIDDNDTLAQALAHQDVAKHAALGDRDLQKVIKKYHEIIKKQRQEMEEVRKAVNIVRKEYEQRLQQLKAEKESIQVEAFESFKKLIRKLVNKVMSFLYKLYKQISIVIGTVDAYIQKLLEKYQEKLISKIAGNNIAARMIYSVIFATLVGTVGQKAWTKFISALPLVGPVATVTIIIKFVKSFSSIETTTYQTASAVVSMTRGFESVIEQFDQEFQSLDL